MDSSKLCANGRPRHKKIRAVPEVDVHCASRRRHENCAACRAWNDPSDGLRQNRCPAGTSRCRYDRKWNTRPHPKDGSEQRRETQENRKEVTNLQMPKRYCIGFPMQHKQSKTKQTKISIFNETHMGGHMSSRSD